MDILIFSNLVFITGQLFLLFISICLHTFTFNEMFASFVNKLDSSTGRRHKTDAIRKLIEFHLVVKRWVCLCDKLCDFDWLEDVMICPNVVSFLGVLWNQATHLAFILVQHSFGILLRWRAVCSLSNWLDHFYHSYCLRNLSNFLTHNGFSANLGYCAF